MAKLTKISELASGKIIGIATNPGTLIVATDKEIFTRPIKQVKMEQKKVKKPKGPDGKMGGGALKKKPDVRRAGYELPK